MSWKIWNIYISFGSSRQEKDVCPWARGTEAKGRNRKGDPELTS
jgi:hypothetical protein